MSLVRVQNASIAFGPDPVLDRVSFSIDSATRTALVGRNGEGKSTLLKCLAGLIDADSGEIVRQLGLTTAYLPQTVPSDLSGSTYEVVASGLAETGQLLAEFFIESQKLAGGQEMSNRMTVLQDKIDAVDGWRLSQRVDSILTRMDIDANTDVQSLSGGMKRRVVLARALVEEPDILLLDEPTNHLDIGAIAWLERMLKSLQCSIIFVTHDRAFLDAMANRIIELDRGEITEWPGTYAQYKSGKQKQLETEQGHNALFDKKLAQEEAWIREGIKARRTRNEGRVRALKKMREQFRSRRSVSGTVKLAANQSERSGKLVFEATDLSFGYADETVVNKLSLTVLRGDRIGIIGPNGCGKSTLVRLLLGDLTPVHGTVHFGTQLEIAYFDQLRTALNKQQSAADNVSGGSDNVVINGQSRHIMSYMQDFLFQPARARAPITALSGGELGRLMLAKLFMRPSNVLVLDEPSNDLDIETLELLETLLSDYKGTVILISHDRELIENVVTRSLVFQGNGRFVDVAGGYDDFERERKVVDYLKPVFPDTRESGKKGHAGSGSGSTTHSAAADSIVDKSDGNSVRNTDHNTGDNKNAATSAGKKARKLSYKLQRELESIPNTISELESSLSRLHEQMNAAGFFDDQEKSAATILAADEAQQKLDLAYQRWEELEQEQSTPE